MCTSPFAFACSSCVHPHVNASMQPHMHSRHMLQQIIARARMFQTLPSTSAIEACIAARTEDTVSLMTGGAPTSHRLSPPGRVAAAGGS